MSSVSTKITEIKDKACVIAWSPHKSHSDVIALGTKDSGGVGFEDYGGEFDLYDLNLGGEAPKLLKTIKTTNRFGSLAWSSAGYIVGGMTDGSLIVYKFTDLLKNSETGDDKPFLTLQAHNSEVKAMQFNPLIPTQLATGCSDGSCAILNLEESPTPQIKVLEPVHGSEVRQVAWNTQVEHILATAHADGLVTVWDLKQSKPWCQLRSPEGVSDVQWNPTQGLHLVTCSADDRNPILKLWDLRASTSIPISTLVGHSQGILSLDWCPHDDSLLVSTGKDNRTILWDLLTLKPIAEIPNDSNDPNESHHMSGELNSSASNVYGAAASAQQKRYHVKWSPLKRGVICTCSLDRKVQAHSLNGLVTKCGRPPKWLKPNSGVVCGFGGTLLTFGTANNFVTLTTVVEQPKLIKASAALEEASNSMDTIAFCAQMASTSILPSEKEIWAFMQVIFQENARSQLLEHLGFHPEDIAKVATEFSATDDVTSRVDKLSLSGGGEGMSAAAEKAIKDALVVGNFEAAVECCFRTGNLADALILASCGGADLWQKTQGRYFSCEGPKKSFLGVVGAVVSNEWDNLVMDSTDWRETLAIVSTYARSEDFPTLCIQLGDKLEAAGDLRNASLCFMCSLSLERTVKYWKTQLDRKGSSDLLALHDFCRKVSVFMRANPSVTLEPEIAAMFDKYATALTEQGLLVTAAKYVKSSPELKDRLYRSRESPSCLAAMGGTPPDFPFSMVSVNKAPTSRPVAQQHGYGQQQQQQQSMYAQQQQKYGQQQQYGQQQAYSQQSYPQQLQPKPAVQKSQPVAKAVAHSAPAPQQSISQADELPPGWMALQDPSSGMTYYANQTTGETSWEKPAAPAPAATNGTSSAAALQTPSKMASRYGDGFVTSASHPELAEQYGNVGTSNSYMGVSRPGTAAVSKQLAPVSGTYNPAALPDISEDSQPIKEICMELVSALQGMNLTAGDKKQLQEGEKGVAILLKRLGRNDIAADVTSKMLALVNSLKNGDYPTATSTMTALVSTDWRDNKDWLKGIKNLIQLATKKFHEGR